MIEFEQYYNKTLEIADAYAKAIFRVRAELKNYSKDVVEYIIGWYDKTFTDYYNDIDMYRVECEYKPNLLEDLSETELAKLGFNEIPTDSDELLKRYIISHELFIELSCASGFDKNSNKLPTLDELQEKANKDKLYSIDIEQVYNNIIDTLDYYQMKFSIDVGDKLLW